MVRGNDRARIFRDDQDKVKFLDRLGKTVEETRCAVYAWVLMDNHIHLLFRSGELGLSAAEMARHLGVNTSSIVRALERVEREAGRRKA
jgi:REP element-mobilizing transposase RayT